MNIPASRGGPAAVRAAVAVSESVLRVEKVLVGALMGLVTSLILLNVITRYIGFPLYWVDEAAVYTMVWLAFIGASALTRMRMDFAVTLISDHLSEKAARWMRACATFLVLCFAVGLAVMCWLWLDPIGIARAGFDAREFAAQTFNFVYTEHTQTLEWPTWAVSLTVPLFALTLTLHSIANLVEDMGLAAPRNADELGSAEGVN